MFYTFYKARLLEKGRSYGASASRLAFGFFIVVNYLAFGDHLSNDLM